MFETQVEVRFLAKTKLITITILRHSKAESDPCCLAIRRLDPQTGISTFEASKISWVYEKSTPVM